MPLIHSSEWLWRLITFYYLLTYYITHTRLLELRILDSRAADTLMNNNGRWRDRQTDRQTTNPSSEDHHRSECLDVDRQPCCVRSPPCLHRSPTAEQCCFLSHSTLHVPGDLAAGRYLCHTTHCKQCLCSEHETLHARIGSIFVLPTVGHLLVVRWFQLNTYAYTGFDSCWPFGLELTLWSGTLSTRFYPGHDDQFRLFQTYVFASYKCIQRIKGSWRQLHYCYTNLLTYLLTYLLA